MLHLGLIVVIWSLWASPFHWDFEIYLYRTVHSGGLSSSNVYRARADSPYFIPDISSCVSYPICYNTISFYCMFVSFVDLFKNPVLV